MVSNTGYSQGGRLHDGPRVRTMRHGNTLRAYALIGVGMTGIALLFAGLTLGEWRMHFPYSLLSAVLAALPAWGVADLFVQATQSAAEHTGTET
ncbi:hypothetical protein E5162_00880 [Marinicauda pacifica]|uniref:Uncharacterized protein n=2 Tax=Marinicauda pacifica TaxID=1133559 RepID=A0A4V3RZD8_9PROT|nr:hypothetical protein E5162_00880 [Marinicauda pacifica]